MNIENYKVDYDIQYHSDLPCATVKAKPFTEEELKDREIRFKKYNYLNKFGIYIGSYASVNNEYPSHPDGIHDYDTDAAEATRLVMEENKELPEDLKERLLYYKSIMDKEREK